MEKPVITIDEVKQFRQETGASFMDAKRFLMKRKMRVVFDNVKENGSLEDKVNFLMTCFEETYLAKQPWEHDLW